MRNFTRVLEDGVAEWQCQDLYCFPQDIADAIAQMHEKARYRQLLLFVETCEAETLTDRVYSPDVLTIATSKLGACFPHCCMYICEVARQQMH